MLSNVGWIKAIVAVTSTLKLTLKSTVVASSAVEVVIPVFAVCVTRVVSSEFVGVNFAVHFPGARACPFVASVRSALLASVRTISAPPSAL